MRRLLLLLIILCIIFAWTSCRTETTEGPTATVTVTVKAVCGSEPFVVEQYYDYPAGGRIGLRDFSIFMSDISLITENGKDEVLLDEIAFLDISAIQYNLAAAESGWQKPYLSVPVGNYKGIKFGLGVAHENNAQNPTDFASSNPLGVMSRYSEGDSSYIFERIVGIYERATDTSEFRISIVNDVMYTEVVLNKEFSVDASGSEIDLTFDVQKVFSRNDSTLNLIDFPVIVSPALPQMQWLSTNLQHSFSF